MTWRKKVFVCLFSFIFVVVPINQIHGDEDIVSFQSDVLNEISNYIGKNNEKVFIKYKNLITDVELTLNSDHAIAAASTIKLPLALLIAEKHDNGELDLTKELIYKGYHYYEGSGVIRYEKIGSRYQIEELIKLMLVHSDNIAFIMLKEYMGQENFVQYIEEIGGVYAYPNGRNLSSPQDLVIYLERLYTLSGKNKLAEKLVRWLKETEYNDTIPNGTEQEVAHKVGMIPMHYISNDAGIVYDKQPYALAIMTTGFHYEESKQVISEITQIISDKHQNYQEAYKHIPTKRAIVNSDAWELELLATKWGSSIVHSLNNWFDLSKTKYQPW